MNPPYRILLAEDHAMLREEIAKRLSRFPELEILGEAGGSERLLNSIEAGKPDLVVLDNEGPGLSSLEVAAKIKQTHAEIKVLLLSARKSTEHILSALEAKVDGYLLKKDALEDLIRAVETIRSGRRYLSSLITRQLAHDLQKGPSSAPKQSRQLSNREAEVLKHIAGGGSYTEIAAAMRIGTPSVRIYIWRIKKKLGLESNADLTEYAVRNASSSLP
jgi:DNA-binding NarL/FixJ family response regulator